MPVTPPPGYLWRPATVEDAAALAALLAAVDQAEDLEEVLGPEGAAHYLAYPDLDPARDTLLAATPDGSVLAFAWAWVQEIGDAARAILWIEAHPKHTGLEPFLLAWAEARARERLDETPPATRRYLRLHAEEHRRRRRRVIEQAGYHHARTFVEMHRPLPGTLTEPPRSPSGVSITRWSEGLDDAARRACNRAFSTHWDALPLSPESWRQRVSGDPTFRPDLSHLAVSAGEVVALCLAGVNAEANDREGTAAMWVERVGTIPARQRQGLATTLLLHTLRAGTAAGMTRAGLTVDEEGTSGATALYERLGFTAERRTLAFVKDVA